MKRYFSLIVLALVMVSMMGGSVRASNQAVLQYPDGTLIGIELDNGDYIYGLVHYQIVSDDIDNGPFPYGMVDPASGSSEWQTFVDRDFEAVVVEINREPLEMNGRTAYVNIYAGTVLFR